MGHQYIGGMESEEKETLTIDEGYSSIEAATQDYTAVADSSSQEEAPEQAEEKPAEADEDSKDK